MTAEWLEKIKSYRNGDTLSTHSNGSNSFIRYAMKSMGYTDEQIAAHHASRATPSSPQARESSLESEASSSSNDDPLIDS